MTKYAKIIGATALAALLVAPPVMAREGGLGAGTTRSAPGMSGGGGKIGGGMGGGGKMGGGINRGGNFGGGQMARQRAGNPTFNGNMNRGDRGPRNFGNWNGGRKFGNWNGPGGHHHHHRHRGLRFYSYGAPYFYDDYYDYGYAAWDDGDSCGYYWRKWQQTGRSIWRNRYYNCVG